MSSIGVESYVRFYSFFKLDGHFVGIQHTSGIVADHAYFRATAAKPSDTLSVVSVVLGCSSRIERSYTARRDAGRDYRHNYSSRSR